MKTSFKKTGRPARNSSGLARSNSITSRRPFDPVAYAAALEMLG